jgi:formamidopyrimidine-DNA glycosylase
MPELPEVETVRAGLARLLEGARIARAEPTRADLRRAMPAGLAEALAGARITAVRRRAKYLLIDTARETAIAAPAEGSSGRPVKNPGTRDKVAEFHGHYAAGKQKEGPATTGDDQLDSSEKSTLLCHLGMTGTWRLAPAGDERLHDHFYLHLDDGRRLAFRDPRRFGLLDLVGADGRHPALDELGPEPLDEAAFTAAVLADICAGRKSPIKALIMDQSIVVGVGNIYAQEALFRAGIKPSRAAGSVPKPKLAILVDEIRSVLRAAIKAGGSTISDFRQAGGDSGYFQHDFRVYGRAGEKCFVCSGKLRGAVVGGRGTTWCGKCQK